jgi:hypothetical protein
MEREEVIMKTSTSNSNHSRPAFARLGKIVSAAAFGLLIGAFAIGPAQAKDHGDHDRGRGHEERHEHEYRGRGYYRDYAYGYPDYYYAPAPNYYYEPEPYNYGYYPPGPGYGYYDERPSEGILQFFGF